MKTAPIFLTILFSAYCCVTEVPKMVKEQLHRELAAFLIILFFGALLAILKAMNVEIPNPTDIVKTVYEPIVSVIKGALE